MKKMIGIGIKQEGFYVFPAKSTHFFYPYIVIISYLAQ